MKNKLDIRKKFGICMLLVGFSPDDLRDDRIFGFLTLSNSELWECCEFITQNRFRNLSDYIRDSDSELNKMEVFTWKQDKSI